jgi:mannose/fructose/N-acetylgalactosamine-specific phosphotransferase system component IID
MRKISKLYILRVYVRSFFAQTGWTYDRMLALGFVWILIPVAKKLCSSAKEQKDFLKRHLASFNANPYLAGYAVGAVTRLEEDKAHGEQICRFKDSLRGPLGALGDSLIWHNFRPALLILGLILTVQFGIYGAVCVWIVFNVYQIYLRARGTVKGYSLGFRVSSDLSRGHLQNMTKWSGRMGAGFLGILLVFKFSQTGIQALQTEKAILLVLFIFLSFLGLKRNTNPGYILLFSLFCFLVIKAVIGLI